MNKLIIASIATAVIGGVSFAVSAVDEYKKRRARIAANPNEKSKSVAKKAVGFVFDYKRTIMIGGLTIVGTLCFWLKSQSMQVAAGTAMISSTIVDDINNAKTVEDIKRVQSSMGLPVDNNQHEPTMPVVFPYINDSKPVDVGISMFANAPQTVNAYYSSAHFMPYTTFLKVYGVSDNVIEDAKKSNPDLIKYGWSRARGTGAVLNYGKRYQEDGSVVISIDENSAFYYDISDVPQYKNLQISCIY